MSQDTLCMLVSVCFHNLVTYAQRLQDLYSECLMFWMRTHTGPRFIVSSEGRESHQPQVIWASYTNSKIFVPDGPRTPSRMRYLCATDSLSLEWNFTDKLYMCLMDIWPAIYFAGLFWRIHQMDLYQSAIIFILGTIISTYLVAMAYKNVKFILKHK
jgi:hypothetical protein